MHWDISTHGGNKGLLRELQRREVSFLVVGGASVAVHGCRYETHFDELDVLVDPTLANAERVIAALVVAGVSVPFSGADLAKPRMRVPVHNVVCEVDILTPQADEYFADLLARSVSAILNDLSVRVLGRADLIAMKRLAVEESENPDKHRRDLKCLLESV
jgi:hypothetical protein